MRYVRERKADREALGTEFAFLVPNERLAIMHPLDRLKTAGLTSEMVVDQALQGERRPSAVPQETVARDFLAAKATKGLQPRSLRAIRASVNLFLADRRQRPIAEITAAEVRESITCNGWKPATMRTRLGDVQELFAFAVREGYLARNLALAMKNPSWMTNRLASPTVDQC